MIVMLVSLGVIGIVGGAIGLYFASTEKRALDDGAKQLPLRGLRKAR